MTSKIVLCFILIIVVIVNTSDATLIIESFTFKYNKKYLVTQPTLEQLNNSTLEFKANSQYFQDILKMTVRKLGNSFLLSSTLFFVHKISISLMQIAVDLKAGKKLGNKTNYNYQVLKIIFNKCSSRSSGTFIHRILSEFFTNTSIQACPIKKV